MNVMDENLKRTLDSRLAKGEISLDEYRRIITELTNKPKFTLKKEVAKEKLLAEIDDLRVYSSHIEVAGRYKSFDEVTSVSGDCTVRSINLVPYYKKSWISVKFSNGDEYYTDEDRTIFGRDRHRKIGACLAAIRQQTFLNRFNMLVRDVLENGVIPIGVESIESKTIVGIVVDVVSQAKPFIVSLNKDGTITNGVLTLDLKKCRAEGVLELGVERANKYAPGQVYASHTCTFMEQSRSKALKFDAGGVHPADAILYLLNWLASSGNDFSK